MKKLKLNTNAFSGGEVLSRAELKKVMGGVADSSGSQCSSQCLAIGSKCGTTENPGTCEWVSDSHCKSGGYGLCFIPFN